MRLLAAGVPRCGWSLASFRQCRNKLGTMGQGISPLGSTQRFYCFQGSQIYGLLQLWLSQETKDHRVTAGPENLCCYLKKKK